jgi:hypothetical protein
MKSKILSVLKEKGGGVSFVELSEIEGFTGELVMGIKEKNIIFWHNVSKEAIHAINELIKEEKLEMVTTQPIVYHVDGEVPRLPIAKQDRKYNSLRWQPVAFNKGVNF